MDTEDIQVSHGFNGPVRDGRYLLVDDFDMWVEKSGEGPPLLLLNGGFGQTDFPAAAALAEAYARHFSVYAFDARVMAAPASVRGQSPMRGRRLMRSH